jgi:DNA-directed DNA polymerase III PolC
LRISMNFTHLHVHSYYSFLDGAASPAKLLEKAKELGMSALALTDHNRLTGAIRFYDKARSLNIKPIIGAEVDIDGGYHLTLLCKDRKGYKSLCHLLTEAHLLYQGKQPAVTREILIHNHEGLIALSGCRKGEIPALLHSGNDVKARLSADFYHELFGDDFFIELTRYPSHETPTAERRLVEFARELGLPVMATNNVHYIHAPDYRVKELLNAIGSIQPVSQVPEPRTMEQYLKSPQEMVQLFKDIPEAIVATSQIADRCNLELELGRPRFPKFPLPPGQTDYSYLREITYDGALRKYGQLTPEIEERLTKELDTIRTLGFCSYFLVVWDIVRWAKQQTIRCLARGSAVDSLVVYTLDISNVDPIKYDLLFERFMHPLRNEPPDVDLDIDRRRRDEVRNYICERYGQQNVACVATINTYMARGAIRDAGKALHIPKEVIDEACKGIHYLSATQLMESANTRPELKHNDIYYRPELKQFFELCTSIDGFPKHLSVHLGGLLIGESNLCNDVPLELSSGGDIISQYDKDDVERLGIVKMDILALPTLTVIEDTIASIKKNHGIEIDIDNIPRNDSKSFAMLRDGKTVGTFQLESPAQREMAGRLLPHSFEDIIVSISLVRPGPLKSNMDKTYLARRHGKEKVAYLHPRLKKALGESLGVILYQEQVLKVAHDLAGMTYAEADGFRRAMTHDRTDEEMEKMRESFTSCALKNGVSKEIADKVFEQLAAFAAYGFCKAHAVAYAIVAYQTLWLKCHYPAEYFAAVLSNQPMGYYPPRVLIAEARRTGVGVLPLEINHSSDRFTVENGAIRVGFNQLKGMDGKGIKSILRERARDNFTSAQDCILRTELSRPVIENLVKAGAFDAFGDRAALLASTPNLLETKLKGVRAVKYLIPDTEEHHIPEKKLGSNRITSMLAERELLSLDLSAHPLDFFHMDEGITRMKDLPLQPTGRAVKIVGSVIRYQTPPTRNGKRVVYIIMEDGTGIADVTVFSDVQEKYGDVLFREGWLAIDGTIQRRGPKALSIIADRLSPMSKAVSAHPDMLGRQDNI